MKTNKLSIAFLILLFAAFTGCKKDDDKFKEVKVTEVTTLYSPDDERNVFLQPTGSPTLYFEWEKAVAEDNGVVYYDVLFAKPDGDFSNPLFTVVADNNGTSTGASIPHKLLNKIARLAGIASGKDGKLKWTVASSRGLTRTVSEKVRTINITRTNGIDAPDALFLTGEGTEGGANLAQALILKALPDGNEFEIYTRLVAGKNYSFVDSRTNVMRTFSVINGSKLVENADGGTVAKDGIYKVFVDFTNAAVTFSEVTKLDLWMCTPETRTTLTYQGKGVWRVNNIVPDFTTGWPDDRYFFKITIGGSEQKLGSINKDNQPPGTTTGSYFFTYFNTNTDRWDYSFKFPNRSVPKCSIEVSFSAESNYTHEIIY